MRRIVSVFLLLSLAVLVRAQEPHKWKLGVEAGVVCSVLDADMSNLQGSSYKVRPGVVAGLGVEYNVYDNLAVGTGVSFIQRDYLFQKTRNGGRYTRYNNNLINIPLTIGYYLFHNPYTEKGFWAKVQGGVFYEYLAGLHTSGRYPVYVQAEISGDTPYMKYSSSYDFSSNDNHLRRSLWGAHGGVQVGYSFRRFDVLVSYAYHYGFSHIYQEKAHGAKTTRRNSSVITVGAAYKF